MFSQIKGGAVLGVASLIALSGCAGSAFAAPVNTSFKDDNLFTCVLQNYNHKNSTTLTKKVIFNIPYLLCVNKIEEYEKNDIIYTYDKESAVEYAATIIEDEFIKNKVLNDEKILRIQELVVIEDEESFKITFLIKKIESIGEFKENV